MYFGGRRPNRNPSKRSHARCSAWTIRYNFLLVVCTAMFDKKGLGHLCGTPGTPMNGTSYTKTMYSRPGETAHYTCKPGFTLFGEEERVCLASGIWEGRLPTCAFNMVLNHPTLIVHQLWSHKSELAVDDNPLTCAFTPRISEQRWWQVDILKRIRVGSVSLIIDQDIYHEFTIFVVELLSNLEALYKPCIFFKGMFTKQRMLFQCNKDKGIVGQFIYIRDDRKDYEYFGLCDVQVFENHDECGDPEVPIHGEVEIVNDTALYTCQTGHVLSHAPNRTCLRGGHWAGFAPQCDAVSCVSPPKLKNADVLLVNKSTKWNSELLYTCHPDYFFPHGPNQVVVRCLETGLWGTVNGSCVLNDDRHLPVKLRDKNWRSESVWGNISSLSATPTIVVLIAVASSMLLTVAASGILICRRIERRQSDLTPPSSTNNLIQVPEVQDPISPSDIYPVLNSLPTALQNLTPRLDGEVVYATIELPTFRNGKYRRTNEKIHLATVTEEQDNIDLKPEMMTLYAQIDFANDGQDINQNIGIRESCKQSTDCDCSKYTLVEDLTQFASDVVLNHANVESHIIPQVCLLPGSNHLTTFDPGTVLRTISSEKL